MATLCSHCGKALLKEDARFCNNCGTLVASHPFSPQSLAAKKNADAPSMPPAVLPAPALVEPEKPGIREQIAQQPSSHLAQQAIRDELPDWVNTPEEEQPHDVSNHLSELPARSVGKEHVEKALSTMHELRVRVWEQKETISMIAVPETPALAKKIALAEEEIIEKLPTTHLAVTSVEQTIEAQPEEEAVEDRPTQLMEVPPSAKASPIHLSKEPTARPHNPALEKSMPRQATPLPPVPAEMASPAMDAQKMRESYLDEVEHLDTLHLPAQVPAQFAPSVPVQPQPVPMPVQPALPEFMAMQNNAAPAIATPPPLSRNRLPFIVVSALLLILVLTGAITWVYLYQPFSVASITQPQQSFKDAALGVSLLYPSGWSAKVDRSKATLHLADSSNTAQVTITVANGGGDLNQYLQQQATQLAMTGARSGGPVTFAGASWQQMQGTMQQGGANYTATLFATTHGDHLVTLLQLAQQTVYPDEETIVFAPIRSSLQLT